MNNKSYNGWDVHLPQLTKIVVSTFIGTIILLVGLTLFYIKNKKNALYAIIILSFMSLLLSYSSIVFFYN